MAIPKSDLGDGSRGKVTTADRLRVQLAASQAGEQELKETLQLETSLIEESATDITNVVRAVSHIQIAEAQRDAEAVYQQQIASTEGVYREVLRAAVKRLEGRMVQAAATFEASVTIGNQQAERILEPAKRAYDRQVDLAVALRDSIVHPAAAEYLAQTERLAKEFAEEVHPSRLAYEDGLKRAAEARAGLLESTVPQSKRGHERAAPAAAS